MNKIAILGAGLSGMLAAKALEDSGFEGQYDILTKEISCPKGYTFLHDNCNMDLDDVLIEVVQIGSKKAYKRKLNYEQKVNASWKTGLKKYWLHGHDACEAMYKIVEKVYDKIVYTRTDKDKIDFLKKTYDKIISTIPLNCLYPPKDNINYEYTEIKLLVGERKSPGKNIVTYDGVEASNTIRYGRLNRKLFYEYPPETELEGSITIKKPIVAHNVPYDYSNKIILAGRNGEWNKNILAHQVYWKIFGMVKAGRI